MKCPSIEVSALVVSAIKTLVREQVDKMKAGDYFKLLAELLKDNPPASDDAPMVAK